MTTEALAVTKQFTVKTGQARAFRLFTDGMTRWWPPEHNIGASPLKSMVVEPRAGGRWYSIGEDGSQCDVGRVITWAPDERLVLSWQITAAWKFDPAFSTEIEVLFTALGPKSTRVDFAHRQLERYGDAAPGIFAQLDDPKGWHGNLDQYAATAALKAVVLYTTAAVPMERIFAVFPAHKARLDAYVARGELLAVGPWSDRRGSMAVFTDREAAEAFVKEDPFVLEGLVAHSEIKDWVETLL